MQAEDGIRDPDPYVTGVQTCALPILLSRAGRDKNHLYVVIGLIDQEYLFLANGDTKTVINPKKKKVKHLSVIEDVNDEIKTAILNKEKSTDLQIKRFLKLKGIVKEGWLPYVKRWCYRNARYGLRIFT